MQYLSEPELKAEIHYWTNKAERGEKEFHDARNHLGRLEAEQTRRQSTRLIEVPYWALEVLSAHARRHHENLSGNHRTSNYAHALDVATAKLGREIWPRDIKGEYDERYNRDQR